MERHGISTARVYGVFESSAEARRALEGVTWPVVIKADGLCAGKAVLVASNREEAEAFVVRAIDKGEFGEGGRRILLEEGLKGKELSYIVLTDGERVMRFVPTRDHKRVFDGDRGPNTGGMGAFSDDSLLSTDLEAQILRNVVQPTIQGLRSEGISYRGFLYFGLMLTADGPRVLEYNCRMGDPETQAILLRADFDLGKVLMSAAQGDLSATNLSWKSGVSICVVLAAKGYPEHPTLGARIYGLEKFGVGANAAVFHAGTRRDWNNYYVSGGRVLGVCALGPSIAAARAVVYDAVSNLEFEGMHYRHDIGGVGVEVARSVANSSTS
jgi:phosphoribosylamine--glycine ligase